MALWALYPSSDGIMFQDQEVVIADEKVVLDIQEESSEPFSNGEENSFGPCLRDINTCVML